MMIRAFTTLAFVSSALVACDLGPVSDGGSMSIHEAAFTPGEAIDQASSDPVGDVSATSKLSCSNGGMPAADKCSARDECPDVTDDDGVTYDGVCQTLKKSNGEYTCGCVRGRKIDGLEPADGSDADSAPGTEESSSDDAGLGTYDDDLAASLPAGGGSGCRNGGQPDSQKCSERNDCPDVTTSDGITYEGVCMTEKKSNGEYTCTCGQGAKKKTLAAI